MKLPTKIASSANIDSENLAELINWSRKIPAKELRKAKGNLGENIFHWAAVSSESLIYDAKEKNVDINGEDKYGMTPLDWLVNRSYLLTLDFEAQKLTSSLGLADTRKQAMNLGAVLLGMGAKTSVSEEKETPIVLRMMKGGISPLAEYYVERHGSTHLTHWINGSNAFHFWAFMPELSEKARFLKFLIDHLDITSHTADENGNTPIHYAAMALEADFERYQELITDNTFMTLELAGFDPNLKNNEGKSAVDYYPSLFLMNKNMELKNGEVKKTSIFKKMFGGKQK